MVNTIPCSEVTEENTEIVSWWLDADQHASIDMSGATEYEALKELLSFCNTDEERGNVLAGSMVLA